MARRWYCHPLDVEEYSSATIAEEIRMLAIEGEYDEEMRRQSRRRQPKRKPS